MPKERKNRNKFRRHNPLHVDIECCGTLRKKLSKRQSERESNNELDTTDIYKKHIPASIGRKILEEAAEQLVFDDNDKQIYDTISNENDPIACSMGLNLPIDSNGYIYVDEADLGVSQCSEFGSSYWGDLLGNKSIGYKKADFCANNYNNSPLDLVSAVLSKLKEKEQREGELQKKADLSVDLPEKVIKVYSLIGEWLSQYKSGKLPKALIVIPRLVNWEEILHLTNPSNWTPNAMHEVIRIFCSSLNPNEAQKFYYSILYPTIRNDISQNYGKLNYHYYQALKKAIFKPCAWFKGILLPLAQDQTCTVKEAIIIGSILSKVSVPVLHAAAALIKLSQIKPWNSCQTHFMMILLNKRYAMPRKVIDELVLQFDKFNTKNFDTNIDYSIEQLYLHSNINLNSINKSSNTILPVIWHKTLLTFVQRYKYEFSPSQTSKIQNLVKSQYHYIISPEIVRELSHSLIQLPGRDNAGMSD
ncbi:bystin family protein [Cryptosporidium andersoni]|uniref:Bystin family protein n=1 Tax=Cryptosporidium andersoni TaxID=117008 RepID=A0A1J4MBC0_9CRYT|nr:bystin family protein [Cryptosporidium andersoni]